MRHNPTEWLRADHRTPGIRSVRGVQFVLAACGTAASSDTSFAGHVGADSNLGMTHDDLDVEPCTTAAHHDLIAGTAVTARPADFAELGLTGDSDVGVISQADGQRSGLSADSVTAGLDRALDRRLPSLYKSVVDLSNVQQLGRSSSDTYLAEMRHPLGVQAACSHFDIDDQIWVDTKKELLAEPEGTEVLEAPWRSPQDAEAVE